jgi:hypothetical protein
MLDVLRNPPPVTVSITWKAVRVEVPDTDRTVLIFYPEDEEEPVGLGWYDAEDECFYSVDGFRLGMVTWWADKPAGPGIA